MKIMEIVNAMQPNTISKLALNAEAFHGEPSIPFMGAFVQLFPNANLPAESDVIAYAPTYDALVAQQQLDAAAAKRAADPATQIANLTAALINAGVLTTDALPVAQMTAVNAQLESVGQPTISVTATPVQALKVGP